MRRTKELDDVLRPLEDAFGKLSGMEMVNGRIVRLRISQAIQRRPDLNDLLSPVFDELDEQAMRVHEVQRLLQKVKSLIG